MINNVADSGASKQKKPFFVVLFFFITQKVSIKGTNMKKFFLSMVIISCCFISNSFAEFSPGELENLEKLTMDILGSLSPEEQEAVLRDAMALDEQIRSMSKEEQEAIQKELELGLKDMMESGAIESLKNDLQAKPAEDINPITPEIETSKDELKTDDKLKSIIKEISEIIGLTEKQSEKHHESDVIVSIWNPVKDKANELRVNLLVVANDPKISSMASSSEFSILKAQIEGFYDDLKEHSKELYKEVADKNILSKLANLIDRRSSELKIGLQKLFEKFPKEDIEAAKKSTATQLSPEQQRSQILEKEKQSAKGSNIAKPRQSPSAPKGLNIGEQRPSPLNLNRSSSPSYAAPAFDDFDDEDFMPKSEKKGNRAPGGLGNLDSKSKPDSKKDGQPGEGRDQYKDKNSSRKESGSKKPRLDFSEHLENQKTIFKKKLSKVSGDIKSSKINETLTAFMKEFESKPDQIDVFVANKLAREIKEFKSSYDALIAESKNAGSILKNYASNKSKEEGAKFAKLIKDKKPVNTFKQNLSKITTLESTEPAIRNLQKESNEILKQYKEIKKALGLKED